jgi:hypothetical protein
MRFALDAGSHDPTCPGGQYRGAIADHIIEQWDIGEFVSSHLSISSLLLKHAFDASLEFFKELDVHIGRKRCFRKILVL